MTRRRWRAPLALLAVLVLPVTAATALAGQPSTWSSRQLHASAAERLGHDGSGVTVAVLDTWVNTTHPDFQGRVYRGADCAGGTCRAGRAIQDGCEPHGTHVAGIIASSTYGIAPKARILPVRVLAGPDEAHCTADSADVARAIAWAVDHGAQVINLSLGTSFAVKGQVTDVARAVHAATARGVLVVASAGNEQAPVANAYGAEALVVAATGPSGRLATYSQRGAGVDLAAPGGDPVGDDCDPSTCVVSTWSGRSFAAYAGTSMAAPEVSGIAALLIAQSPHRSLADVVAALTATAHPLAGAGAGRVDAAAALQWIHHRRTALRPTADTARPQKLAHTTVRAAARPVVVGSIGGSPRAGAETLATVLVLAQLAALVGVRRRRSS